MMVWYVVVGTATVTNSTSRIPVVENTELQSVTQPNTLTLSHSHAFIRTHFFMTAQTYQTTIDAMDCRSQNTKRN